MGAGFHQFASDPLDRLIPLRKLPLQAVNEPVTLRELLLELAALKGPPRLGRARIGHRRQRLVSLLPRLGRLLLDGGRGLGRRCRGGSLFLVEHLRLRQRDPAPVGAQRVARGRLDQR